MTERLYLLDSEYSTCDALVTACQGGEGGWLVTLDKSVFFPNKGGQPCDLGTIGGAAVTACFEREGELYHVCDRPLEIGERVKAEIDYNRRFDIMQQHTGEHVLSYCAWKEFSAVNVGFHCAMDYATLDLDKPLTQEEVWQLERLANATVSENRSVSAKIYNSEDDIKDIPLRKHAEGLTAPIRLVTVEGGDCCTCCAPHVKSTGMIGHIKIVDAMAYKGGLRITFLCGSRATEYSRRVQAELTKIARLFSTSYDKAFEAVVKQGEELSNLKRELRAAIAETDRRYAEELIGGAKQVRGIRLTVALVSPMDGKRLKNLCTSTLFGKSLSVLLSPFNGQVGYVLSCSELDMDMGECIAAVNAALNGKGGGRGTLAQGSAKERPDLAGTVLQLSDYFERLLR
ncbi:MAG: DHHA1 domain-containing protein [Clostridia bacterium]|nr:DHHA1 domain-containing protein [Clostridia bacterium]